MKGDSEASKDWTFEHYCTRSGSGPHLVVGHWEVFSEMGGLTAKLLWANEVVIGGRWPAKRAGVLGCATVSGNMPECRGQPRNAGFLKIT